MEEQKIFKGWRIIRRGKLKIGDLVLNINSRKFLVYDKKVAYDDVSSYYLILRKNKRNKK